MLSTDLIGSIAASFTTIAFLPQALKVIRERETHAISLWMYLLYVIGVAMWLLFGILIHSVPVMLGNGITLMLAAVILGMKLRE